MSFDPNLRKELVSGEGDARRLLDDMLAVTDLLLPSGDELTVAAAIDGEENAIAKLLSMGVSEIVLKRGPQGSSFFSRNHRVDCPGFVVDEVDPTGAGDCFGATFVTCRRQGREPIDALRYANAAGARTVTKQGPMEGASSFPELDQFIATNRSEV